MTIPPPPLSPESVAPGAAAPSSGLALGSLITGIASIVLCGLGLLLGPVAVVLGFVDRGKGGRSGMSLAGIVMGFAGFAISAILVAMFAAGAIFHASATPADTGVNVDDIIKENFPDSTAAPAPQQDFGDLPVDERAGFPIAEGYIVPAGYDTAYDAWTSFYRAGGQWDGIYDGNPVDTPCYSYDGTEFWTLNTAQDQVDLCIGKYELWFETYSGIDQPVIKQFGFGGVGSAIEVEPVSREFSDTNFPGKDTDAMVAYLKSDFFTPDWVGTVDVSSGQLGGLPATIFEVEHPGVERYRVYAVFTPKVYPGGQSKESEFFLITLWNEAEWVASSDDFIAAFESSFAWK